MPVPPTNDPAAKPLRIFVAEDHRDTREMMQMYLEGLGYQVATAGTMAEALALLAQTDCDVLISDIGLSDGTVGNSCTGCGRPGPSTPSP